MASLRRFRTRLREWLWRGRTEREIGDEIQSDLELRIDDYQRRGFRSTRHAGARSWISAAWNKRASSYATREASGRLTTCERHALRRPAARPGARFHTHRQS